MKLTNTTSNNQKGSSSKASKLVFVFSFIIFMIPKGAIGQTQTFATGSYIINMGVTPQTINNGLRPYGMVYDLIKEYNIPIAWSINPSKVKDGIDFSHNGIDYRGGPFIIPAEFRTTAVNARITFWQGQGVVGATTVSPITVPVYKTLKSAPRWTLDKKNGSIAAAYLNNAQIPPAAYGGTNSNNWKDPFELNCCDDIFLMPHADPTWATHNRLVSWNLECQGAIWAACHAVSYLENMVNLTNRTQQGNFLSVKDPAWTGTSGNWTISNSLILTGSHADGSPPYTYRLPADPIQQYLGILDAATTNGSEQIYIPRQGIVTNPVTFSTNAVARWNPGANVLVYDPTQTNVSNPDLTTFKNVAAALVYGRGYDNPDRGLVMYEGGHNLGGTAPANIAAQRAVLNFSFMALNDKVVLPVITGLPTTVISGTPVEISYTLPPGANPADYTTQWLTSCAGSFSPNSTSNPATFTPPIVTQPTPCVVSVVITDLCGRTFNDANAIIIQPCVLTFNNTTSNVSCFGLSNGQINLNVTGSAGPFLWNWSRVSPTGTGMGTGTTISGLQAGTYNVTVTDGGACTGTFTQVISQPNLLTVFANSTNYVCFGQTGAINLSVNGGTQPFTYDWADIFGNNDPKDRLGLLAGTYNVTVTDANNCTATASAIITGPSSGVTLTLDNKTNVTCNGDNNGTIHISTSGGTPGFTYLWNDGATSEDRTGLSPGTYTVTVTDSNSCTSMLSTNITQPAALLISAIKANPTCPPGADPPNNSSNGSIDITVTGGTPGYVFDWSDLSPPPNEPEDRTSLSAGTYSVTVTDANGCTVNLSTTLTEQNPLPAPPTGIGNN